MSKTNEEDSPPTQNQNQKPNPNPNSSERLQLLKKSKTFAERTGPDPNFQFAGPLFPTVRRIATLPNSNSPSKPSDLLRVSVANGNDDDDKSNHFSDRDWNFPSFLGAHPSRNRVHVKPRSNHVRPMEVKPSSAARDEKHRIAPPPPPPLHARNRNRDSDSETDKALVHKEEKKVVMVAPSQESSLSQLGARRTWGFKHFLILYLLSFTCMVFVPYAVHLQKRVSKLQEENRNLCRLCGDKNVCNGTIKVLPFEDNSPKTHFSNAYTRTVALYSVVFTLLMPFLLYKYLDRLPQMKSLTKSTKIRKEEVPLKKRVAYMVDVCFSVYPYAKLLALLFATIFVIGFGGLALYAVSESSFAEALWLAWTFVADSGNHADSVGTGPRIVSVSISSGGMLIFAMMLGLVSDAISEKVDSLRKGKSEVIERNHILILGWSDKLGSLLKQLAIANKSIGGGVVVVLAERDKEEMEMDIAKLEFDFMGTSVICRSGSPLILADLKKVSVSKARAIIVLASHENADQSDARALRVVLSLTGVKEGLRGHVVVEMSDIDNEPLVKLVGGELIETVVAHDVIGRLMIQCALQPGLAQIWEDILGFENAEFYIKRWPELDGLCFKDVLISFPDAIPCGIKVAAEGGKIIINPDDDYVLKEGDEVLVIAEDDDTYAPDCLPEVRRGLFPKKADPPKYPKKILFCGWRRDIDDMIMVLEAFLAPGSELWMFNEVPEKERERKLTDGGLDVSRLENIKLVHHEGNAVIRRHLENLPLETFDSMNRWRTLLCKLTHVLLPPFSLSEIYRVRVLLLLCSPSSPLFPPKEWRGTEAGAEATVSPPEQNPATWPQAIRRRASRSLP